MTSDAGKSGTIGSAVAYGAARVSARDAELLLRYATGRDKAFIITHPDAELTKEQQATYEEWLTRRERHEPIQYITGEQEFYGLAMRVTPAVLIPRPETEHLVEAAFARAARDSATRIADVGTGSGAIAITLAHKLPQAQVAALDSSQAALAVARGNAERHKVADRVRFMKSDLLRAVAKERFDMIVSNPPYVPEGEELEPQVRDYEPQAALFAGPTGLEVYQRLVPQAREILLPQGWLLLEIGHGQFDALAVLLGGWNNLQFIEDLQGIPRVACAQKR
ncbi:MAG TPA: peptide chain release factor N(5)-glutamine methyltransferase [Acidobacteriaceae bacterium]|nr:peptide chain release factor N(5)-glutamine methyltransferase [Acidobacteriaceae bacterium]